MSSHSSAPSSSLSSLSLQSRASASSSEGLGVGVGVGAELCGNRPQLGQSTIGTLCSAPPPPPPRCSVRGVCDGTSSQASSAGTRNDALAHSATASHASHGPIPPTDDHHCSTPADALVSHPVGGACNEEGNEEETGEEDHQPAESESAEEETVEVARGKKSPFQTSAESPRVTRGPAAALTDSTDSTVRTAAVAAAAGGVAAGMAQNQPHRNVDAAQPWMAILSDAMYAGATIRTAILTLLFGIMVGLYMINVRLQPGRTLAVQNTLEVTVYLRLYVRWRAHVDSGRRVMKRQSRIIAVAPSSHATLDKPQLPDMSNELVVLISTDVQDLRRRLTKIDYRHLARRNVDIHEHLILARKTGLVFAYTPLEWKSKPITDLISGHFRSVTLPILRKARSLMLDDHPYAKTEARVRIGSNICDEERQLIAVRQERVRDALKSFLSLADLEDEDVPVTALCGSGGGCRAMVSFVGGMLAAEESGMLDCFTYISGLSGSSWAMNVWLASQQRARLRRQSNEPLDGDDQSLESASEQQMQGERSLDELPSSASPLASSDPQRVRSRLQYSQSLLDLSQLELVYDDASTSQFLKSFAIGPDRQMPLAAQGVAGSPLVFALKVEETSSPNEAESPAQTVPLRSEQQHHHHQQVVTSPAIVVTMDNDEDSRQCRILAMRISSSDSPLESSSPFVPFVRPPFSKSFIAGGDDDELSTPKLLLLLLLLLPPRLPSRALLHQQRFYPTTDAILARNCISWHILPTNNPSPLQSLPPPPPFTLAEPSTASALAASHSVSPSSLQIENEAFDDALDCIRSSYPDERRAELYPLAFLSHPASLDEGVLRDGAQSESVQQAGGDEHHDINDDDESDEGDNNDDESDEGDINDDSDTSPESPARFGAPAAPLASRRDSFSMLSRTDDGAVAEEAISLEEQERVMASYNDGSIRVLFEMIKRKMSAASLYRPVSPAGIAEIETLLREWLLYNESLGLADIWGANLAYHLLGTEDCGENCQRVRLSSQRHVLTDGRFPFPINSAIVRGINNTFEWIELSPLEIGGKYLQSYVPTWAFGRKFENGVSVDDRPEQSLGRLMGVFGSAFCATVSLIVAEIEQMLSTELIKSIIRKSVTSGQLLDTQPVAPSTFANFTYGFISPEMRHSSLSMMDAGLDYNLPMPPLLRRERGVELIVVMDASGPPQVLKHLQLRGCEAWAKRNGMPFPSIDYAQLDKWTDYVHVFGPKSKLPHVEALKRRLRFAAAAAAASPPSSSSSAVDSQGTDADAEPDSSEPGSGVVGHSTPAERQAKAQRELSVPDSTIPEHDRTRTTLQAQEEADMLHDTADGDESDFEDEEDDVVATDTPSTPAIRRSQSYADITGSINNYDRFLRPKIHRRDSLSSNVSFDVNALSEHLPSELNRSDSVSGPMSDVEIDMRSDDFDHEFETDEDADKDDGAPIIVYFPMLANPEYSSKFDPLQNLAAGGYCSTFNMHFTREQVEEMAGLTHFNVRRNVEMVRAAFRDVVDNKHKARMRQLHVAASSSKKKE
ncbi:hypothetical protein CAOG_03031 [Capsaspora owczarzaki ATCC 30864]|uniref:hypothetical protein n=1 Tax=Capsaspora owczarzaki (strain ATCC 30864) TaxID=595528 RepID=UPI0003526F54|nr:hypothetical protein CAOG_03031 [Capsaspora owczarzaki ATCC 30864]|eukprot:XP_004363870.2 hypothetical protein CAOG_03031 [Capsaspora owczarzaki ATCC 30864]